MWATKLIAGRLVAFALLCGMPAAVLLASIPRTGQKPTPQDAPLRLASRLVSVPVIVEEKKGGFVAGLTKDDFQILESGRPQPIEFFSTEESELLSRPLAVVFALDSSGSAVQTIHEQRAAAAAFLRQLSSSQLVAITRFSAKADTLADFTTDRRLIEEAFARHVRLTGNTALFDGVQFALQKLQTLPEGDRNRRRIVVVISDGLDNSSFLRASDVIAAAEEQDVNIYVVYLPLFEPGPGGHLQPRKTANGFTELAAKTGGQLFQAGDVRSALDPSRRPDLSEVFAKIIQELRSQYYIGYYPADSNFHGEFRAIQVKLRAPHVRLRQLKRGYYATPARPDN